MRGKDTWEPIGTLDLPRSWVLGAIPIHYRVTCFSVKQTRFPLVASFISGSEMRLAQIWCATGVRKNKSQIAMEPRWTLKVCMWDQPFCQDLRTEIWIDVSDTHKSHLDSRISLGSRAYTLDKRKDWRALLFSWTTFGHPAAHCLVLASRNWAQGDARGSQ